MSRNADVGYDDRYDDGPDEVEPCSVCGLIGDGSAQSCPCGCGNLLHPKCAAAVCFDCKWPICKSSVVDIGETYCPDCAVKARAELKAFESRNRSDAA